MYRKLSDGKRNSNTMAVLLTASVAPETNASEWLCRYFAGTRLRENGQTDTSSSPCAIGHGSPTEFQLSGEKTRPRRVRSSSSENSTMSTSSDLYMYLARRAPRATYAGRNMHIGIRPLLHGARKTGECSRYDFQLRERDKPLRSALSAQGPSDTG